MIGTELTETPVTERTGTDTPHGGDPRVARSCARLLDAATELLVEGGARAVTVDAVSERSGVAKSTLYRHYPSRTELMVAVLQHNMPELEPVDPAADFEDALRSLVRGAAATMADPDWARILPALMALKNTVADVEMLTEADRDKRLASLREVLALGVAEGLVAEDTDPDRTLHLLFGPLFIAAMNGNLETLGSLADEVTDRYLASCRA